VYIRSGVQIAEQPNLSYITLQTVHHCFSIYASNYVTLALWREVGYHKLVTCFGI